MTDRVTIVEVGPRDGLQNEQENLEAATKVELINRLSECGFTTVEAGAFVSPKWVPQMADSATILGQMTRKDGVSYPVLTPNLKGYLAAREAGADAVAIFGAASESFSQKNINASIAQSLERFEPVLDHAREDGVAVRGYVSCVLGCPYEGDIPIQNVVNVAKDLYRMGCTEISLGDTIGVGSALRTKNLIRAVAGEVPMSALAGHFHDTYGQAIANAFAAYEEGVRVFDASVAGLGGCPYANGATGNVASEDLAYMFEDSGVATGVNIDALIGTSWWISEQLGRAPSSKVAHARHPAQSA